MNACLLSVSVACVSGKIDILTRVGIEDEVEEITIQY